MSIPHLFLLLLITFIWGINFVVAKIGVGHYPAIFFTLLRFIGVAILVFPFLRWYRGQMLKILGFALSAGALHFAFMYTGFRLADDVSVVAVVCQLGTPISAGLAVVILGERMKFWHAVGIALACAGTVVLVFDPRVSTYLLAVLYIIIAQILMSLSQILTRRIEGMGVLNSQAWIAFASVPTLALISWIFEDGQWASVESASMADWITVIYSVVGVSIVGHGGMFFLLRRYPVTTVTPFFTLTPAIAVVAGIVWFNDPITMGLVLGGLLILAGVWLVMRPPTKPASSEAPATTS